MRRSVMMTALALLAAACGGDQPGESAGPSRPVQPGDCVEIIAGDGSASVGYFTDSVEVEADGRPITICFDNRDEGVPHNIAIATEHGGELLFSGEVVEGPAIVRYELPDLEPMTYHYHCEVHPDTMTGTLAIVAL